MNTIQNYAMTNNSINFQHQNVKPLNIAYKNIKQNYISGGIKNNSDFVELIPIKNTPFSLIKIINLSEHEQKVNQIINLIKGMKLKCNCDEDFVINEGIINPLKF